MPETPQTAGGTLPGKNLNLRSARLAASNLAGDGTISLTGRIPI
jgi:hypothetical protein